VLELLLVGVHPRDLCALREADFRSGKITDESELAPESALVALEKYAQEARSELMARGSKNKLSRGERRLLFFSDRGLPLSAATLRRIVRRHAQTAGLPEWVTPCALRNLRLPDEMQGTSHERSAYLRGSFEKAHPRA
jgi:integrase